MKIVLMSFLWQEKFIFQGNLDSDVVIQKFVFKVIDFLKF